MKNVMQAEFFADQVAQAFAGHGAHARAHLLHYDQRDRGRNHRPQEQVAELRAGLRIRQDAVGIVVDVRGNKSRSYDGKDQQDLDLPASQKIHACKSQFQDR